MLCCILEDDIQALIRRPGSRWARHDDMVERRLQAGQDRARSNVRSEWRGVRARSIGSADWPVRVSGLTSRRNA